MGKGKWERIASSCRSTGIWHWFCGKLKEHKAPLHVAAYEKLDLRRMMEFLKGYSIYFVSIINICSQFSPYYCSLWIWSSHWRRRRRILYCWITTGNGLPWRSKCLILARTTSTSGINCWLQLFECNLSSDKRQSLSRNTDQLHNVAM